MATKKQTDDALPTIAPAASETKDDGKRDYVVAMPCAVPTYGSVEQDDTVRLYPRQAEFLVLDGRLKEAKS